MTQNCRKCPIFFVGNDSMGFFTRSVILAVFFFSFSQIEEPLETTNVGVYLFRSMGQSVGLDRRRTPRLISLSSYVSGGGMNCGSCAISMRVQQVSPLVCVFCPGVFLSPRVTGACPVTTDLTMRVNVRTTTTTATTPHALLLHGGANNCTLFFVFLPDDLKTFCLVYTGTR